MTDMCLRIDGLPQATKGYTLLPFQGVFAAINLPRALPWAMRSLPLAFPFSRRPLVRGVPLLLKHNLFELAKV